MLVYQRFAHHNLDLHLWLRCICPAGIASTDHHDNAHARDSLWHVLSHGKRRRERIGRLGWSPHLLGERGCLVARTRGARSHICN